MITRRGPRLGAVLFLFLLLSVLSAIACSSQAADGASCDKDNDCASGSCSGGTCAGSECTCEGSDCRSRSSCEEGWLCTRSGAMSGDLLSHCHKQCTGDGNCPYDQHCENEVCQPVAPSFTLTWLDIPRTIRCRVQVPCEYKVMPSVSVTVDTYTWTFGSAPAITTHDPTTTFTYSAVGTYDVSVHAVATTGGTADLHTTEELCQGELGAACDDLGTPCCVGTCNLGLCK